MPASTKAELKARLAVMFQPTSQDQAPGPEIHVINAAIAALPDDHYQIYDDESDDSPSPPDALYGLPRRAAANWDGTAEGSWGYGSVELVSSHVGPGLLISVAGSPAQSASSFWIMPVMLEGWILPSA